MPFLASLAILATLHQPMPSNTTALADHSVDVSRCAVSSDFISVLTGDVPMQTQIGSNLNIRFTNTSSRTLRSVAFDVDLDGTPTQINDVGTFSPGVTISHSFAENVMPAGQASCSVSSVGYADAGAN